jgi:hypothetical protein
MGRLYPLEHLGSNRTQGIDVSVRLFWLRSVLSCVGSGLPTG